MSGTKGRSGGAHVKAPAQSRKNVLLSYVKVLVSRGVTPWACPVVVMMAVSPVQSINNRTQPVSYPWQRNGISPSKH